MKCNCCGMYVHRYTKRCNNCNYPSNKEKIDWKTGFEQAENKKIESQLNKIYHVDETVGLNASFGYIKAMKTTRGVA